MLKQFHYVVLKSYVTDRFLDKEGLKKMSKGKSISFNILRSKIRKGMEVYRPLVDEYHKNASNFEDDDDDDDTLVSKESSSTEDEDSVNLSDSSSNHSSEFADDSDDDDFDSNDSQDYEKKTDGEVKRVKFKKVFLVTREVHKQMTISFCLFRECLVRMMMKNGRHRIMKTMF
jgi:hypothetical protein